MCFSLDYFDPGADIAVVVIISTDVVSAVPMHRSAMFAVSLDRTDNEWFPAQISSFVSPEIAYILAVRQVVMTRTSRVL